MQETDSCLVAIMFVQATESTENITELPVASCRLKENQKELRAHLTRYRGEILEISSGEIYACFTGAVSAFKAALSLQSKLPQYNLRIGLHLGEVVRRKGRLQGRDVNLASRLPKLARAGGVCISQSVYQYLEQQDKQVLVSLGIHNLKNIDAGVKLFAYMPTGQANRCKRRELKRKFFTTLQKHKWTAWFLYLAAVVGIFILPHVLGMPSADRKLVKIYIPKFDFYAQEKENDKLLKSIEFTVRSLLSGRHENYDVNVLDKRSLAQIELLVSLKHVTNRLQAGYIINALPQGNALAYGGFEEDERNIFQLQDRLSQRILNDLPE